MDKEQLLEQVKEFVLSFFDSHPDDRLIYHNARHTKYVVSKTKEIAGHFQLDEDDAFALSAAAWFHDTGYVKGPKGHEEKSAEFATDFFKGADLDEAVLDKIKACILATRMPQMPENVLESIICDADLYHLGTNKFPEKSKQMREEHEAFCGIKISKEEWREKNIDFLRSHKFNTDYCRLLLEAKKQKNIEELMDKQKKTSGKKKDKGKKTAPLPIDEAIDAEGEPKTKDKLSKGVETMFRTTTGNQQRLSSMADSKAHIMISVNSIIISLLISLLLRKIEDHLNQLIPAILLLIVNLVTIIFSILATRPNVTQGTFTRQDVYNRNVNLLFFGNFYKMDLADYTDGMFDMMNDDDFLYRSLVRDLHAQGAVLGRKYYLLRISYNVFMYGLVGSVLAFVISTLI